MKSVLFKWVLPLGLTAFFLYVAFSLIEHPERIPGYIAAVPWHVHVLFVVISMVSMYARAIRWKHLLPGHELTSHQCFPPLMVGFMMNSILPGRAGEFARCVVLNRSAKVPFTKALGSVVLERLFDGVVLLASFALVLFLLGASLPERVELGNWTIGADQMRLLVKSSAVMVVIALAGIVIMLLPITRHVMEKVASAILPEKVSRPIIAQIEHLIAGFHALRSPVAILIIIFWSLVVWATVSWSVQVAAKGFPELSDMTFMQAWAIMVFICVAILLPASPGYWGLYELGVLVGCLALNLITPEQTGVAMAFSVVIHLWQIVPNLLIGLYFLWAEGLKLGQLQKSAPSPEAPQG